MLSIRDQLAREVSALYGFVDSVSVHCCRVPQSVAYPESSTKFFNHIQKLATSTKRHLAAFPLVDVTKISEESFHHTRDELRTIRRVWQELHQFVKSSTDADTLNQPGALVAAMLNRTREIPGFQDADFAIFHRDTFDYLQVNPTSIRDVVRDLAFIVGAEEFLPAFGLIGIPSTQGGSVFLNCLIAHEIGEFVYAEKLLNNHLQPEAETALLEVLGQTYESKDKTDKSAYIKTVLGWAKELFCDLFAVFLVGPCYTFAFVEVFDLPNLLDRSGAIQLSTARPPISFYAAHPSHPFRVKYQADLLKRLDWWFNIRDIDSRSIQVLASLLNIPDEDFARSDDPVKELLVHAFFRIIPEISSQLGNIVGKLEPGVYQFNAIYKHVAHYLREGIVPSTIIIDNGEGAPNLARPDAVPLLNCFACFYLEQLESLMKRVADQDLTSPNDRLYWIRKLESWTSKALEDIVLRTTA